MHIHLFHEQLVADGLENEEWLIVKDLSSAASLRHAVT